VQTRPVTPRRPPAPFPERGADGTPPGGSISDAAAGRPAPRGPRDSVLPGQRPLPTSEDPRTESGGRIPPPPPPPPSGPANRFAPRNWRVRTRLVVLVIVPLVATIVGATARRRQGREPVQPRANLGHAANLLWMVEGKEPDPDKVRLVDTYLVLLADHGLNASTFAARVVASTGSDLTSCVVGAIAALKGPAHGGATLAARTMLDKIGSADNAEKWLTEAHARHERFSGFGHRVYRTYDPRAKILRELAKTASPELYETAARTEEVALRILHEAHPDRPNATNVDFWASVVLTGAGIPKELFTTLFATSRVAGWTAHVLESLSDLRLIRPASRWVGPEPGKKPMQLAKR